MAAPSTATPGTTHRYLVYAPGTQAMARIEEPRIARLTERHRLVLEQRPAFETVERSARRNIFVIIWTTTPWTIPGNRAIRSKRRRLRVMEIIMLNSIVPQSAAQFSKTNSCSVFPRSNRSAMVI